MQKIIKLETVLPLGSNFKTFDKPCPAQPATGWGQPTLLQDVSPLVRYVFNTPKVLRAGSVSTNKPTCPVQIEYSKQTYTGLIDSGAQISLVDHKVIENLVPEVYKTPSESNIVLLDAFNRPMDYVGKYIISMQQNRTK